MAVMSGMSGYVSREGPPAGHPRFMGYRHDGCRRMVGVLRRAGTQGLLVAPCRTEMIIANAAGYEEWSNHFRLNHSTNIRQYSILIVTVKHGDYFSEVEHVLSFVFCRRGVEFASGEPLADLALVQWMSILAR